MGVDGAVCEEDAVGSGEEAAGEAGAGSAGDPRLAGEFVRAGDPRGGESVGGEWGFAARRGSAGGLDPVGSVGGTGSGADRMGFGAAEVGGALIPGRIWRSWVAGDGSGAAGAGGASGVAGV